MDDTDAGHRNLWVQTTAALEKGVFDFAFTNSRSPEMPKLAVADSCGFEGSAPDTIRARFSAHGRREARVAQACTGTPAVCADGTRLFETGRRGYSLMFTWLLSGVSPARACHDRAVEKDRLGDMITLLARAPDG